MKYFMTLLAIVVVVFFSCNYYGRKGGMGMKFEPTLEDLIECEKSLPGGSMTAEALQNGKLTLEEVKQGYYINLKGEKVADKAKWGPFIEDRIKKDLEKLQLEKLPLKRQQLQDSTASSID